MTLEAHILELLRRECDIAAQRGASESLRTLHTFMREIAANYVRLRLAATEARRRGDHEAADGLDRLAADLLRRP